MSTNGFSHLDKRWMELALKVAAYGHPSASPNPLVGAVVVDAEGKLAGVGFHAVFGGPHAERVALWQAGDRARGGTLYVTLEPCNHHGKTPPCTDAILEAGISRVVVAMEDPNPAAAGGLERLQSAGITVDVGLMREEAEKLNMRWVKWAAHRIPWVTLKAASSLDGKTATRSGDSKWITPGACRRIGLKMREEHDAILVGVNTVLADNPALTRRLGINGNGWHFRVILDSRLRTPPTAKVIREKAGKVVILHTEGDPKKEATLKDAGAICAKVRSDEEGRPDLMEVLKFLGTLPVSTVLVEGGSAILGAFLDRGLWDEMVIVVGPMVLGGEDAKPITGGTGVERIADAARVELVDIRKEDDCAVIRAIRRRREDSVHRSC